jgi:hypothetical protein
MTKNIVNLLEVCTKIVFPKQVMGFLTTQGGLNLYCLILLMLLEVIIWLSNTTSGQ